jgi:hypothetical protein
MGHAGRAILLFSHWYSYPGAETSLGCSTCAVYIGVLLNEVVKMIESEEKE